MTNPPPTISAEILRASRDGPALVSCTVLTTSGDAAAADHTVGAKLLVYPDGHTLGDLHLAAALAAAVQQEALHAIPRHSIETVAYTPDGQRLEGRRAIESAPAVVEILLEVIEPSPTLLVVGGGHVGRSIGELGALLGMSVAILDDREEYANAERFPFADTVICGDFADELDRFPINAGTYVVMVSRGHKVDELSLGHVAGRGAAYVGMIGSLRRTATVLDHLRQDGVDAGALDRVFTPIGLDIGSETPAEIALAVIAEITLVRRGGTGSPLSPVGQQLATRSAQPETDLR
jgi:xanthine dehydrogenase accessory factor